MKLLTIRIKILTSFTFLYKPFANSKSWLIKKSKELGFSTATWGQMEKETLKLLLGEWDKNSWIVSMIGAKDRNMTDSSLSEIQTCPQGKNLRIKIFKPMQSFLTPLIKDLLKLVGLIFTGMKGMKSSTKEWIVYLWTKNVKTRQSYKLDTKMCH